MSCFHAETYNRAEKSLYFFSSYQILLCILELKYFIKIFASKTGDKLWFVVRIILSFEMVLYRIPYIYTHTRTREPK